jgi:hypothetical protein
MAAPVNVPVEMAELRAAFDFIRVGADFEHSAHVCLDTGKVYCRSTSDEEADAELPADLDTSDRYVPLPDASDLGLSRRLALSFTAQELAADYDTVANYFRRRGAYGRFKDLLHRRGVLQRWYEFEDWTVDEALRDWCKEIGLHPVPELPVVKPSY